MHKIVVFNFGKFKSRKCSISFSRDYARKGQENKKALKIKAFRGYIFFIAFFGLRRWDLFALSRRIVVGYRLRKPSALPTSCFGDFRQQKQLSTVLCLVAHSLRPEGHGVPSPPRRQKGCLIGFPRIPLV